MYSIKDIKGFKLLMEYPGCRKKVGEFDDNTSSDFINYPRIWQPVFTRRYLRDQKLKKLGI